MTPEEYKKLVADSQKGKRPKYGNKKTEVDGIMFDSKGEANRYLELKMFQQGGVIANLQHQVRYQLTVNGMKVGVYVADFVYTDVKNGEQVIEDYKGGRATKTPLYLLKKKLMKAIYGYDIREIE